MPLERERVRDCLAGPAQGLACLARLACLAWARIISDCGGSTPSSRQKLFQSSS